jgi:hypothetical protein
MAVATARRRDSGLSRRRRPLSEFAGAVTRERTSTMTTVIKHHRARCFRQTATVTIEASLSAAAGWQNPGVPGSSRPWACWHGAACGRPTARVMVLSVPMVALMPLPRRVEARAAGCVSSLFRWTPVSPLSLTSLSTTRPLRSQTELISCHAIPAALGRLLASDAIPLAAPRAAHGRGTAATARWGGAESELDPLRARVRARPVLRSSKAH